MSHESSPANNNLQLTYTSPDQTSSFQDTVPPTSSAPPAYVSPNGGDSGGVVKRKRGRPRKEVGGGGGVGPPPGYSGEFLTPVTETGNGKKPRGRPRGSVNKQQPFASGIPGSGFMPHILDVKSGEDIMAKLVGFSQNSTRAMCILSASGAISSVTLQQSTNSGGTVTYEGRFEILSLSGSFMVTEESDGQRGRTGGLSISLSGPDGRVLGGNVAGALIAASPVQVIVGSFLPTSQKQSTARGSNEAEVVNAPAGGSLSESSGGGLGSPLGQRNSSNPQVMANMPWR